MKMLKVAAFFVLTGFGFNAAAALITDPVWVGEYMSPGESHTITHDITDYGVPDEYRVTYANVHLAFADDGEWRWKLRWCGWKLCWKLVYFHNDSKKEYAKISGEGLSGYYEVDGSHAFGFHWIGQSVGQGGIDSLNLDGKLDVTVTSKNRWGNDFWWKKSVLKAYIEPVPVPAPSTLALLGLGLLGLGLARKRA